MHPRGGGRASPPLPPPRPWRSTMAESYVLECRWQMRPPRLSIPSAWRPGGALKQQPDSASVRTSARGFLPPAPAEFFVPNVVPPGAAAAAGAAGPCPLIAGHAAVPMYTLGVETATAGDPRHSRLVSPIASFPRPFFSPAAGCSGWPAMASSFNPPVYTVINTVLPAFLPMLYSRRRRSGQND